VLEEDKEVREGRAQLTHPRYAAPEVLAMKPKKLWSCNITTLMGPCLKRSSRLRWRFSEPPLGNLVLHPRLRRPALRGP
jgi:hypothetical protein